MPHARNGRARRCFPPEILTDDEVRRLLDACSDRPAGIRNRALIAILYRCGLRINEALDLFPKDIDLEVGSIRVLHGKGGRARTVGIDPAGGAVVEQWLEVRSELGLGPRQPVLCTVNGGRVGDAYIRVLLPRLGRRAGIAKRVCDRSGFVTPLGSCSVTPFEATATIIPTVASFGCHLLSGRP